MVMDIHLRDSTFIMIYCCAVTVIFGGVLGSFLNCAAWRIVHGESFVRGRSRCPSCGHALGAADLVPVFSWVFSRGKCRYCGEKVSVRYPLTELCFMAISLLCLLRFDLTPLFLRNWAFSCCLFCLSLTDLEGFIIPDGCLIAAIIIWVIALPFSGMGAGEAGMRVLAGAAYTAALLLISLLFDRLIGRDSMGGGDIKLFGVSALYLGFAGTLIMIFLSCIIGLVFAFIRKGVVKDGRREFPFGPAIAAASWIMLLYGDGAVRLYLSCAGLA